MLTADGMVPAGVDNDKRLQIERQMLDMLAGGMRQAMATSIIIGPLLTAWMTEPHIGTLKAVIPVLLLWAFGVERMFFLRRMARERALRDDAPRRWARGIGWRLGLGSLVVIVWFHFVVESENRILISQMLALFTIVTAGGAALFSSWPPVMWVVVSTQLLGIAVQLARFGDSERMVEAVFCVVLWLVLIFASLRSARILHKEALTRLHNEDLVRELHEKHAQAEAATAAKSRFLAAASHDLRQPLQAMGLYLSVLQPRIGQRDNHDSDTLVHMQQCMTALDQILESLLDLSRMDFGQLTPTRQAIPLQALLDNLAGMYQVGARQRNLQLRVHPTNAWVNTDPALLERALSNLVSNALRYTLKGGVLLAARRRGEYVRLCVVDTGVGISESDQALIFEEFVQLNNPGRDSDPGHGLGLATVQRIADLLEHPITLRSRVGHGSSFMMDVPAAQPQDAPVTLPSSGVSTKLAGRILVVEDNPRVREALTGQLTDWGLQVDAASDGQAACELMALKVFDAVLSDWRLPGSMDGAAILREAKARIPGLKFSLLLTGEDTPVLQELQHEFTVLRKPLRPLRLRTLLARHLKSA
ncbi:hybrid sensor histidine kinase/response regulator [Ottowia thiooxydans]|uniref:hybrid sensor histidine kinase/response regulator n=1 Tax=Ottowia thiooxydans TaxID=219182 RepID=UPI00146A3442|nr:hybrid sensor histidine kinase/response regulator [Ottowia thiooxydans]